MLKKLVSLSVASIFVMGSFAGQTSYAEENTAVQTSYLNPPYQEINRMLTEAALKYDIPPEIVKAIAMQESNWQQFKNGVPYISPDNGIGIMQVTNATGFNEDSLKTNIEYNIDAGVQILNQKFKDTKIPVVNDGNRDVLENWYFAVLAYNGKVQRNSPIKLSNGSTDTNTDAYQEKVFSKINEYNNLMGVYPLPFQFQLKDFSYSTENNLITFNTLKYEVPKNQLNGTKHKFEKDDIVLSAEGSNFRAAPSSLAKLIRQAPTGIREVLTIQTPFVYDESYAYDKSVDMRYRQYVWYKTKLQDGNIAYSASGGLLPLGKRLQGIDRFETAVKVSQEGWESGADTVVLAFYDNYPDALAGTPLAYHLNAPLLLTESNSLKEVTKKEIQRLGAKNAVLLGSSGIIADAIKTELTKLGVNNITRYGGINRFETAEEIAKALPKKDTAILAFGYNFPDALAIAPYAAKNGFPIFLSNTGEIPQDTIAALKNYKNTIVVGDEGIIPNALIKDLNGTVRYGGLTRYDTNAAIVNGLPHGNDKAYVATGLNFPDALTGAVLAAKQNAPILLTLPGDVPDSIHNTILKQKIDYFGLLGGETIVGVQNELGKIVGEINY